MKSAKDYLEAANADVPTMSAEDAIKKHAAGEGTFIDVRDSSHIAQSGTIKGALRIPRGFMEFAADEATDYHNEAMTKEGEYYLVCGAGGQAALTGKTLKEMGYTNVTNVGGFPAWKEAGGPTEEG